MKAIAVLAKAKKVRSAASASLATEPVFGTRVTFDDDFKKEMKEFDDVAEEENLRNVKRSIFFFFFQ